MSDKELVSRIFKELIIIYKTNNFFKWADLKRHLNDLKTTMRYHLPPPEWLKFKRLSITSVGEKAEEGKRF